MSKQTTLIQVISAALLLAATAVQAAPQKEGVITLPRVVVTGKATRPVTEIAQASKVEVLPRVVVTGYSIQGKLRQQALALALNTRTDVNGKPVRHI